MSKIQYVSVVGPSASTCTEKIYATGKQIGKILADYKKIIVCGGMGGVMEAVCRGAKESKEYQFGCTVGILPGSSRCEGNPFCDILIPTNIGLSRNQIVANSGDIVLAIAGGSGTLSEIAYAWQLGKPILAYSGLGGWSENLAGQKLDNRRENPIIKIDNLENLINYFKKNNS